MAVSASIAFQGVEGNKRYTVTNVTFDSSYLSGGETCAASTLGLTYVDYATCNVKAIGGTVNVASAFYEAKADPTTNLLHLWDETPGEVASTADVSTCVVQVKAFGY